MKILQKILVGLVALVVVLAAVSFLLPSQWKVERSVLVEAPSTSIYPLVANLKAGWSQWSAFDFQDKDIQYSYSGPEEGVDASRSWISKKMGDGYQKIVKADPSSGVEFELGMNKPKFVMTGVIAFEQTNSGTKVTWTDTGSIGLNPVHRYMGLLMDKMMGKTFEKSLASLKEKAETPAVN